MESTVGVENSVGVVGRHPTVAIQSIGKPPEVTGLV
jgi:hypothetical protein